MRYQGRITIWKDDKGFGFITPNGGGEQVFVHISSFSRRQRRPAGNELVTYKLAVDGKGRSQAKTVTFVGERPAPSPSSGRRNFPLIFAACFLFFVVAAAFSGRLPTVILGFYLVASVCHPLRLRVRQISSLAKSMANQRIHIALIRSSRRLARCLDGTTAASAQVDEGVLSENLLDHCCAQLRSTRLAVVAFWRESASLSAQCRTRTNLEMYDVPQKPHSMLR